ncbi:Uncharacterized conserved protein, contains ParB-like and HNH nuclease domains [Oscillospiraceae bacterium]|nr:Uncharacterized conserved protein, contains ParB-like and HNH nuclease domains [Oscillospiraceae bacterium]
MASVDFRTVDQLYNKKFYVPAYQRGYRWDKTQVEELLEDLFYFAGRKTESKYCLQPIIVKERKDSDSDSCWELVDGQQRLTALWIILTLYYSGNKRQKRNLVYEKFDLVYEEKDTFTQLFTIISDLVDKVEYWDLIDRLREEKSRSIDSKYLIESIENVMDFEIEEFYSSGVLNRIMEAIKRVVVIWYVLDDEEDPIQTFTNVNANKIDLTNSELIKAVLLTKSSDNEKENRALQWEEIEKKLNNDSLWNFVSRSNGMATRIDYLFEIICVRNKWFTSADVDDQEGRYRIYRAVANHLNSESEADSIWNEVQRTYDILQDWYDDYFFYHMIGLLLIVSKTKPSEVINQLVQEYTNTSKTAFKTYITKQLHDIYISPKTSESPFKVWDKELMRRTLEELNYDSKNKDKIKKILLLYNISLLVIADNEYERFPFDLYKADIWDIEHINPQTPKDASPEEKLAWLSSYRKIIPTSSTSLLEAIELYIDTQEGDFDEIVDLIEQEFDLGDKDSIGNLVLLDKSTNSSYKNACFSDKRVVIIDEERANSQKCIVSKDNHLTKKKYIPIGTKWVFLKGYEKAVDLKVWGPNDMAEYVDDMVEKLFIVLGG